MVVPAVVVVEEVIVSTPVTTVARITPPIIVVVMMEEEVRDALPKMRYQRCATNHHRSPRRSDRVAAIPAVVPAPLLVIY